MLSTTHAALAHAATGRPDVTLGAALPDLPAFAAGIALVARRTPRARLAEGIYHRSPSREAQLAAHALPVLAVFALTRRAPGVRAGWLSHLAIDLVTHHDDAWPMLWPLSRRRWRSPVSYWQTAHHARALQLTEVVLLAALTRRTPLAGPAAAVAALPLLRRTATGVAGVAGVDVDPGARERDGGG